MYSPRPPAPIAAAIVADPTPTTAATRTPATIDGSANGSSTCRSSCLVVIPIAMPASRTAGSMPRSSRNRGANDRQQPVQNQHHQRRAGADAADERHRQEEAEHREARNGLHNA